MSRHREARRSRLLVAVATAALLVVAGNVLAGPGPASSAQTPGGAPFQVAVAQTDGLVDGQLVDVDLTMRPDLVAVDATAFVCRAGATYAVATDVTQNAGNCPVSVPISASTGDASNWRLHLFTGGTRARGTIAIGVGTTNPWFHTITNEAFTLTCDEDNPCALVVRVQARPAAGGTGQVHLNATTTLTYQADDPLASCGGAAPGAVRSAGADRMLTAWREWTVAHCTAEPGSGGAATLAPLPDEGRAVADFAAARRDIVYTAVAPGETGFSPPTTRPAVATPVAVNAIVLAAAGGHFNADDPNWPPTLRRPYDELRLTPQEIGVMLGQGQHHLALTHSAEVLARNPQLGALYPNLNSKPPFVLSGATAASLYMTRYLDQLAGDTWTAGPEFGLAPRGVTANLGVPESPDEPTFLNALSIVSDQTLIDKATTTRFLEISPNNLGPQWVWTDLATATRLGMTPVSLQNANGEWVAPTPASLAAALPTMTRGDNGMLMPDVGSTAPGAYPLTMVEYALAPAEPLVDTTCVAQTGSQELLDSWLGYITGPGQAILPGGFVPLTPALRQEAADAIADVGASPTTCQGPGPGPTSPTTPPPPTSPPPTQGPPPSGDGLGGDGVDGGSDGGAGRSSGDGDNPNGGTTPRESTPEDREEAEEEIEAAEISSTPPFGGIAALNELLPPLSLLLIVASTSSAAFLTSGREPPAGLRATGRGLARAGSFARERVLRPTLALRPTRAGR